MHKIPRRDFLQATSLVLTGAAVLPKTIQNLLKPVTHLGVQLYSVRGDMAEAPVKTLQSIAQMGYREVEGYGYQDGKMFGMPISEYHQILKSHGLSMPSSHCGFTLSDYHEGQKQLSDRAKRAIDDAVKMGQRYIIFPWVSAEERRQIPKIIQLTAAAAAYARKAGIKFGYHNHDFEYTERGPDGRLMIEWLLQEIDPAILTMEMDLYWVCFARQNPLDWFKNYPGRWELCHAKDMADTETRETIEFGDGILDFQEMFKKSKQAGLKYYIIELEHYRTTPLEGVKKARENFVKMK